MRHLRVIILALVIITFLAGLTSCKRRGGGPAVGAAAEDRQPVTVEELTLRELDEFITVSGKLEGILDITMRSEASGRVEQLYKKLGDSIAKGERIGKLDNAVYEYRYDQAEAALASAQTAFENAQRNMAYADSSFSRNLISQSEYTSFQSAYKAAKSFLDGAKAALESSLMGVSGSYFTAPEAGLISNLTISSGQYINAGEPVATITDASRLLLKTGVGESQITSLQKGQRAEISHPLLQNVSTGTVRGFGISPLANSATYPVELEISRPGSLLPGMVVTARILVNNYRDLLYTSITHFSREFGKTYAYVIDSDNVAHKREVTLGRTVGGNVLIESGLEPGDLLVTSGAENLEEGFKVEIRK